MNVTFRRSLASASGAVFALAIVGVPGTGAAQAPALHVVGDVGTRRGAPDLFELRTAQRSMASARITGQSGISALLPKGARGHLVGTVTTQTNGGQSRAALRIAPRAHGAWVVLRAGPRLRVTVHLGRHPMIRVSGLRKGVRVLTIHFDGRGATMFGPAHGCPNRTVTVASVRTDTGSVVQGRSALRCGTPRFAG